MKLGFFRMLSEAIFPATCECCGTSLVDGEEMLCLSCFHKLPRTNYHRESFNEIHKRLASPGLPIDRAASYFHYIKDTPYARLIQEAKYNNRPGIIRHLARQFASELLPTGFFQGIGIILPIPLHRKKLRKRGYNQSEILALGINDVTGIQLGDNLKALPHSTQTRKGAADRFANVKDKITVENADELKGRHILIVDDVITTGATMLAAAVALKHAVPSATISVLSIGASKLG